MEQGIDFGRREANAGFDLHLEINAAAAHLHPGFKMFGPGRHGDDLVAEPNFCQLKRGEI